ncbi:MAG: hypothetical protein ACYSR9_09695, partial [Planctomycetota bacterium]
MNENQTGPNSLLDTTDCLEAIGVFRGWKNFFCVIIIVCLLLLQISFWIVKLDYIRGECPGISQGSVAQNVQDANDTDVALAGDEGETEAAIEEKSMFGVTFSHLAMGIRIVNSILILTGTLYCLTILLALKVSLVGRLGGINHIC